MYLVVVMALNPNCTVKLTASSYRVAQPGGEGGTHRSREKASPDRLHRHTDIDIDIDFLFNIDIQLPPRLAGVCMKSRLDSTQLHSTHSFHFNLPQHSYILFPSSHQKTIFINFFSASTDCSSSSNPPSPPYLTQPRLSLPHKRLLSASLHLDPNIVT